MLNFKELIIRAKRGENSAVEELLEMYRPLLTKESIVEGVFDYNPGMYENMLRRGHNLYCIAADDCHLNFDDADPRCDRYGGFVMIKAPELTYNSIITALKKGDFYASTGPEFYELYITDENKLVVKCSEVQSITVACQMRRGLTKFSRDESFTEAEFDLNSVPGWVQVSITDKYGKRAVSQIKRLSE